MLTTVPGTYSTYITCKPSFLIIIIIITHLISKSLWGVYDLFMKGFHIYTLPLGVSLAFSTNWVTLHIKKEKASLTLLGCQLLPGFRRVDCYFQCPKLRPKPGADFCCLSVNPPFVSISLPFKSAPRTSFASHFQLRFPEPPLSFWTTVHSSRGGEDGGERMKELSLNPLFSGCLGLKRREWMEWKGRWAQTPDNTGSETDTLDLAQRFLKLCCTLTSPVELLEFPMPRPPPRPITSVLGAGPRHPRHWKLVKASCYAKCGPWTQQVSAIWQLVRNAKIPSSTSDLLNQNLHLTRS